MRVTHADYNLIDKNLKEPYRTIWEIGNATGLRISDILSMRYEILNYEKPTIKERKTGKSKRIYIPRKIREKLIEQQKFQGKSGDDYIFATKRSGKHLSRQSVYKAFKKAANSTGIKHIGTHTMRKNYALKQYCKSGDVRYVQKKLNHENEAETLLYIAEEITNRRKEK